MLDESDASGAKSVPLNRTAGRTRSGEIQKHGRPTAVHECTAMKRLLLIACSKAKRRDVGLMPAIERYNGPAFRVLRRYARLTHDNDLIVYILSAEFGLITAKKQIPTYDRRMTPERADALRPSVAADLQAAIRRYQPSDILICAGKTYLRAMDRLADNASCLFVARGGQGGKLAALKAWLHER